MTTKQLVSIFAVLVLVAFIIGIAKESKPDTVIPNVPATPVAETPTNLCYYRSDKTKSGFYDKAWLRMHITGNDVSGEFRNLPAEKDSKVGTFTGIIIDPLESTHTTTVIWDSIAEGMHNKEELLVQYNNDSAKVAFGELVKGANGVYVYKDKTKAMYQQAIPEIDCAALDEILAVETFVRSTDLSTLTKTSPVLGGKMFVSSVVVDPKTHSAIVSYEDGHVAGKGVLEYTFDAQSKKVTITSFGAAKVDH